MSKDKHPKIGDKKPCIADGCNKKAECLASHIDHCMGTLDEIWVVEWKCECGAHWTQGG